MFSLSRAVSARYDASILALDIDHGPSTQETAEFERDVLVRWDETADWIEGHLRSLSELLPPEAPSDDGVQRQRSARDSRSNTISGGERSVAQRTSPQEATRAGSIAAATRTDLHRTVGKSTLSSDRSGSPLVREVELIEELWGPLPSASAPGALSDRRREEPSPAAGSDTSEIGLRSPLRSTAVFDDSGLGGESDLARVAAAKERESREREEVARLRREAEREWERRGF
ncbi:MAG: hypothetical protein AAF517_06565 [Planctomycetota bacterium]